MNLLMPHIAKYTADRCRANAKAIADGLLTHSCIVKCFDFVSMALPLFHKYTQLCGGLIFAYAVYKAQIGPIYSEAPYFRYIIVVLAIGALFCRHAESNCAIATLPCIFEQVSARIKKAMFHLIFVDAKQDKEIWMYGIESLNNPVPRNTNNWLVLGLISKRLRILYLKRFSRQRFGIIDIISRCCRWSNFALKPCSNFDFKALEIRLFADNTTAMRANQRGGGKLPVHMCS